MGALKRGIFSGWSLSGNTTEMTVVSGSIAQLAPHSGNYQASLSGLAGYGYLSQSVTTEPGQFYSLSFWFSNPYELSGGDVGPAIPADFTAVNIGDSGSLDASDGRLAWGPFWDAVPRTFTYTLVPPSGFTGTATLNGSAFFFGATAATSGDNTISMIPTSPTTLGISQFYGYFMITINGTVGSSYRLEAAGDLAGPWEPLVIVTLTCSPWSYVDWESAGQTHRSYRTVLLQ
jgi:hypothetical protein